MPSYMSHYKPTNHLICYGKWLQLLLSDWGLVALAKVTVMVAVARPFSESDSETHKTATVIKISESYRC